MTTGQLSETVSKVMSQWPEAAREAADLVLRAYGEPDECTPSEMVWFNAGPWKRIVATKRFFEHRFPVPHTDSVECFVDYAVPPGAVSALAYFDGSVMVERTAGEMSARCHDEQANFLALNLAHDIITGAKSVSQARQYYAEEFLNYRRGVPTPYMDGLRFSVPRNSADPDVRLLSDEQLEDAEKAGQKPNSEL